MGLVNFLEEKFKRDVDVVSKRALKEELKKPILSEVVYK